MIGNYHPFYSPPPCSRQGFIPTSIFKCTCLHASRCRHPSNTWIYLTLKGNSRCFRCTFVNAFRCRHLSICEYTKHLEETVHALSVYAYMHFTADIHQIHEYTNTWRKHSMFQVYMFRCISLQTSIKYVSVPATVTPVTTLAGTANHHHANV